MKTKILILTLIIIFMFVTGCKKLEHKVNIEETFYLKSDESRLVRKNGKNYESYYYIDDTIVGYSTYTSYDSNEEAENKYNELVQSNNNIYKNLSLTGNVIVIEYTEEYVKDYFINTSVSKLKEKYNDFIEEKEN